MRAFAIAGLIVLGLAACASELSPEKKTVQRANWVKTANAAVPACIAAIEGSARNYSTFRELGYKHINPLGNRNKDVFDSPELTAMNQRGDSFQFQVGRGCSVEYAFEHDSIAEIVAIWISAARQSGYQVQQTSTGKYTISLDGKNYVMTALQRAKTTHYQNPASAIVIRPA